MSETQAESDDNKTQLDSETYETAMKSRSLKKDEGRGLVKLLPEAAFSSTMEIIAFLASQKRGIPFPHRHGQGEEPSLFPQKGGGV